MVMANDGNSLLKMKERMIDPSSAHGSCKSRGSVLSRLSLQSRENEYEEQQALTRSKHGAQRNNSNRFISEASTAMLTHLTDGDASLASEQDCISQLMAESDVASEAGGESVHSSSNSNTKLSPLGVVVKKCSRELQANPPVGERRAQLILQSLLNILSNRSMETTSNALHNATPGGVVRESAAENAKQVAIKYGALPAITCVMKTYRDSSKLQSRAVLILGALGDDSADHQESIANCHGVSFILAALVHSSHSKSKSFCLEACSSLVKVMSLSQRNISQLANGDGVRTIRKVMQIHAKHAGIQQYCLSVLCFVAKQPSPQDIDQNMRGSITSISTVYAPYKFLVHVEDPEVIEVLVGSVTKHRKVKPILQLGGHLLFVLSTQGSSRTKNSLTWSNSVLVILEVMKAFYSSGTTQLEGALSLQSLTCERPEARDSLAEEGCTVLLESLYCHQSRLEVRTALLSVLGVLCDHDHTAKHVSKSLKKHSKYKKLLLGLQTRYKNGDQDLNNILEATSTK